MADNYSEAGVAASLSAGSSPTVVIAAVAGLGRAFLRLVAALRAAGYTV